LEQINSAPAGCQDKYRVGIKARMEPIYIYALSCFLLGAFGYVIYQFWLRPILKYRRLKKNASTAIASYLDTINGSDKEMADNGDAIENKIKTIRGLSVDLGTCFREDLPQWYQLLLKRREESPVDASQHMMVLSNTREYSHARNRAVRISQLLYP
jgi:hypothetical protein